VIAIRDRIDDYVGEGSEETSRFRINAAGFTDVRLPNPTDWSCLSLLVTKHP